MDHTKHFNGNAGPSVSTSIHLYDRAFTVTIDAAVCAPTAVLVRIGHDAQIFTTRDQIADLHALLGEYLEASKPVVSETQSDDQNEYWCYVCNEYWCYVCNRPKADCTCTQPVQREPNTEFVVNENRELEVKP